MDQTGSRFLSTEPQRGTRRPCTSITTRTIFHVLEGEVQYRVGDQERRTGPGEMLLTPKGLPHTYRVVSDEARMLTITRGEFENFIRTFGRPAEREGLPDASGPPTPEQAEALARACQQFGIELVGPPLT